jgi:hypothetical protein
MAERVPVALRLSTVRLHHALLRLVMKAEAQSLRDYVVD